LYKHLEVVQEIDNKEPVFSTYGAGSDVRNWYAVYVKSRHEFVSRDELRDKGIETFLPTVRRVSQWKDRKKLIEFPVFPGYVFVRVASYPSEFFKVIKTRGVVTFISLEPGNPTPVSPDEINALRLIIESGRDLDVYPHLREGTRVRLKRGPLKSAEGMLSKKENQFLFLVNIELLGRSIAVKVGADDIEEA
jgi:transcription antitermination factor NusG